MQVLFQWDDLKTLKGIVDVVVVVVVVVVEVVDVVVVVFLVLVLVLHFSFPLSSNFYSEMKNQEEVGLDRNSYFFLL